MIIRWPGRVAAGARSLGLVSWVDVLPTLIEAAGGLAPNATHFVYSELDASEGFGFFRF